MEPLIFHIFGLCPDGLVKPAFHWERNLKTVETLAAKAAFLTFGTKFYRLWTQLQELLKARSLYVVQGS